MAEQRGVRARLQPVTGERKRHTIFTMTNQMNYYKIEYIIRDEDRRYVISFLFASKPMEVDDLVQHIEKVQPSPDWHQYVAYRDALDRDYEMVPNSAEVKEVVVTTYHGKSYADGEEIDWGIYYLDDENRLRLMEEIIPNG